MFGNLFKKKTKPEDAVAWRRGIESVIDEARDDPGVEKVFSWTHNGMPATVRATAFYAEDDEAPPSGDPDGDGLYHVYIAATDARLACMLADAVDAEPDLAVVSDWHDGERGRLVNADSVDKNLGQILDADVFILCSHYGGVPGSKFVEAGYALAHGIPVVVWGERENAMLRHRLVSMVYSDKVEDVLTDVRNVCVGTGAEKKESAT